MNNPLLIEILKDDANGTYTYHYNKGGGGISALEWKPLSEIILDDHSEISGEELENILDNLNCQRNNAVTMDLTYDRYKAGNKYCCNKHDTDKRASVGTKDVLIGGQKFKEYYKHQINAGIKLAKIKYYPQGTSGYYERRKITTKGLIFPIDGAVSVYVFYCNNKPVIIHVDSNQKRWYKRKDKDYHDWAELSEGLNGKDPDNIKECEDLNKIRGELEKLGCGGLLDCSKSPGSSISTTVTTSVASDTKLTIQLSQNKEVTGELPTKIYGSNNKITVIRSDEPPNSDFTRYSHTLDPHGDFTLKTVLDDQNTPISIIQDIQSVTSVSAYYWKHEEGGSKTALIVEVVKNKSEYIYYINSKASPWKLYDIKQSGALSSTELEKKLTLLNCEINDVIQIDVTRTNDYCHDENGAKKVKVTPIKDVDNLGNYVAYHHTPANGSFIVSGFKKGKQKIELKGLRSLPLMRIQRVFVYFCGKEVTGATADNPLLIYIEDSTGDKWFKKSTNNDE